MPEIAEVQIPRVRRTPSRRTEMRREMARAANELQESGEALGSLVHIPTSSRANEAGYVEKVAVSAAAIHRYVDRLGQIRREFEDVLAAPDAPVARFYADLRGLVVDGRLEVAANFPLYLDHSRVDGGVRISLGTGCTRLGLGNFEGTRDVIVEIDDGEEEDSRVLISGGGIRLDGELSIEAASKRIHLSILLRRANVTGAVRIQNSNVVNLRADDGLFRGRFYILGSRIVSARFSNAEFHSGWLIGESEFEAPPDFFGVKMDRQHTRFRRCKFTKAGSFWRPKCGALDVVRYRHLRSHFARCKDSYLEGLFYTLEMRGHRLTGVASIFERAISWLYDAVADYGNSVARPALFFLGQILFFFVFYKVVGQVTAQGVFSRFPELGLVLQNSFNPLALFTEKGIAIPGTLVTYAASLLQATISVALIALFLIALRGKFRRGGGSEAS